MKPPIFVRTLSKQERQELESGLRSKDAFVLRRCQILLASARREHPPRIADTLDPTNSLQAGVTYKAVVSTGAKEAAGNPLAQQYRWFFTVR